MSGMTSDAPKSPQAEANRITKILNLRFGVDRFPVNVEEVALEISKQTCPEAPITDIRGEALEEFDGLLTANKTRSKWLILYNSEEVLPGRQRFTLAHEFGHYMLHRDLQNEFYCNPEELRSDAVYRQVEKEANQFASTLLMPLDDFRKQVQGQIISFDLFGHCADRYGVSLTAAILKWLDIASERAILVASRDDFLLWAKSSRLAYQSRAVFATRKKTIEVPANSIAHSNNRLSAHQIAVIRANAWFPEEPDNVPLTEISLASDQYDMTLTLLLMPKADWQLLNHDDGSGEDELDGAMSFRR